MALSKWWLVIYILWLASQSYFYLSFIFIQMKLVYYYSSMIFTMKSISICSEYEEYDEIIIQ